VLGGPNTKRSRDALGRAAIPSKLQSVWAAVTANSADVPVLIDLESDEPIGKTKEKGERYGPIFVPYHDYRILYAEHSDN